MPMLSITRSLQLSYSDKARSQYSQALSGPDIPYLRMKMKIYKVNIQVSMHIAEWQLLGCTTGAPASTSMAMKLRKKVSLTTKIQILQN